MSSGGCYTHHYPICVRRVLVDDTLISMASGGDEPHYSLSFVSYDRPRERAGFFRFAAVLADTTSRLFAARPHWGKYCPIDTAAAERLYPQLPMFRQVCDEMDKDGVFRNEWVKGLFFANPISPLKNK